MRPTLNRFIPEIILSYCGCGCGSIIILINSRLDVAIATHTPTQDMVEFNVN